MLLGCLGLTKSIAQTSSEDKTFPVHFEIGLGCGTAKSGITPVDAHIDINYEFVKNLSVHLIGKGSMYVPKEGETYKYNRAANLGGGLSYTIPKKDWETDAFEIRADVTTTLGKCSYKNTSYDLGIYWYKKWQKRNITPIVGFGYSIRDFSDKSLPNHYGFFASIGIRF